VLVEDVVDGEVVVVEVEAETVVVVDVDGRRPLRVDDNGIRRPARDNAVAWAVSCPAESA
jgi:hypothetical protein